jgi:hypothetical protein
MQDLGPDMEDLLRKASENYPLKQTEDKWAEIASKASGEPTPPMPLLNNPARSKRYLIASLLLALFLFFGIVVLKQVEQVNPIQKDLVAKTGKTSKMDERTRNTEVDNTNNTGNTEQIAHSKKDASANSNAGNKLRAIKQQLPGIEVADAKNFNTGKDLSNTSDLGIELDSLMRPNISRATPGLINMEPNRYSCSVMPGILLPDSVRHLASSIETAKKIEVNKAVPVNRLYYGVIAGPGFSTIEKQGITKAGLNIGVLAGYQLSKLLSIEAGVMLSQKLYSTSGAHFSMKIIGPAMPSGMNVMEIDGSTRVIEIPVNLRYAIFQNNKRKIFSVAGFSSYIVDKESNQYHTSMNGAAEMMYGTYKSNKGYFASSINFGIGYEQKLGNKNTIRIQPYVQLPLKGMGVGDLHVMSTGLYIGITRTAH